VLGLAAVLSAAAPAARAFDLPRAVDPPPALVAGATSDSGSIVPGVRDAAGRAGRRYEPPPEGYAALGRHPAYAVRRFRMPAEVDAYCRAHGVDAQDEYRRTRIEGCVVPATQEVVLPQLFPGALERAQALEAHENAHTWRLVHKHGRGWFTADGAPAAALKPYQVAMLRSLAEARRLAAARAAPAGGPLVVASLSTIEPAL
jgi:hypothetical protein